MMAASDELDPQHYEAIGRVVVSFQLLEEAITFALIRLTRPDPGTDVDINYVLALSELSFKSKTKLLRNHVEHAKVDHYLYEGNPHPEDRVKLFAELIRRLKSASLECELLEEKRNQYMHSIWRPSVDESQRLVRRYKLRVQAKKTVVADEEVSQEVITALGAALLAARDTISTCSELLASVLIEKRCNAA